VADSGSLPDVGTSGVRYTERQARDRALRALSRDGYSWDECRGAAESLAHDVLTLVERIGRMREAKTDRGQASGWFTVVAGIGRGQLRREIEKGAWSHGLEIKTDESKGFLESVYRFTVTGDSGQVRTFLAVVSEWLEGIAGG
jgi:hypothetical protein